MSIAECRVLEVYFSTGKGYFSGSVRSALSKAALTMKLLRDIRALIEAASSVAYSCGDIWTFQRIVFFCPGICRLPRTVEANASFLVAIGSI